MARGGLDLRQEILKTQQTTAVLKERVFRDMIEMYPQHERLRYVKLSKNYTISLALLNNFHKMGNYILCHENNQQISII